MEFFKSVIKHTLDEWVEWISYQSLHGAIRARKNWEGWEEEEGQSRTTLSLARLSSRNTNRQILAKTNTKCMIHYVMCQY